MHSSGYEIPYRGKTTFLRIVKKKSMKQICVQVKAFKAAQCIAQETFSYKAEQCFSARRSALLSVGSVSGTGACICRFFRSEPAYLPAESVI